MSVCPTDHTSGMSPRRNGAAASDRVASPSETVGRDLPFIRTEGTHARGRSSRPVHKRQCSYLRPDAGAAARRCRAPGPTQAGGPWCATAASRERTLPPRSRSPTSPSRTLIALPGAEPLREVRRLPGPAASRRVGVGDTLDVSVFEAASGGLFSQPVSTSDHHRLAFGADPLAGGPARRRHHRALRRPRGRDRQDDARDREERSSTVSPARRSSRRPS